MNPFNLQTGKIGEEIAKKHLEDKGYKILEQNYRTKFGEIDLLAEKNKGIILVEVRTKRGEAFGSPEESLNKKKLRKLSFNARFKRADRIDAICIVLKPDNTAERLNHYENII